MNSAYTHGISSVASMASELRTLKADARDVPSKGEATRLAILNASLNLASQIGLEGLSIGAIAEMCNMSKSGVFAHFGSRDELQICVIREYFARFEQEVFYPALGAPRGLPRLQALFDNWMKRVTVELQSGCIFISGAVEFDDRGGAVSEALQSAVGVWLAAVERCVNQAVEGGHLKAHTQAAQFVYEMHSYILGLHYEARFLKREQSLGRARTAFGNLIAQNLA